MTDHWRAILLLAGGAVALLVGVLLIGLAYRKARPAVRWLSQPGPRNVAAWLIALGVGGFFLGEAWYLDGHVTCDFAGQWLLGRMIQRQEGDQLYLVEAQRKALASGYKGEDLERMDRDILQKGTVSAETGIEGPLYPPTAALLMAPVAILEPRAAHAVTVLIYTQLAFVAGLFVRIATRGRLRCGEASCLIMLFPSLLTGLVLGQNCALTLFIVAAGWVLWAKDRPWLAGLVWGALAYKPVFAVALIWVPLALMSWRMFLGMAAGGALFVAATLPFCGLEVWQRWWFVGHNAAEIYTYDRNWIWMSRDLVGLPRRELWDLEHVGKHLLYLTGLPPVDWDAGRLLAFVDDQITRLLGGTPANEWPEWKLEMIQTVQTARVETVTGHTLDVTTIGWALLGAVAGGTILLYAGTAALARWRGAERRDRAFGPRPAFLLMGALLTCFHFMHYDLLPLALPLALLVAAAGRLGWAGRTFLALVVGGLAWCNFDLGLGVGSIRIPFETLLLLAVWLFAGAWMTWEALRRRTAAAAEANGEAMGPPPEKRVHVPGVPVPVE